MASEPAYESLTGREREVLALMARGLTNGQIAEHLDIGFETAKTHVSRIINKTGAQTREEAVARYRAANRPPARMRRSVRGWWGLPGVRIGAGIVGVAGVAAIGLGIWYASNDDDAGDPGPLVRYFEREANSSQGIDVRIPLAEAIERQREAVGLAPALPTYLGDFGLIPQVVAVTHPMELTGLPGVTGITRWSVWYGNGATEDANNLQVGFVRQAQIERLEPDAACDLPDSTGDWTMLTTPNSRFQVLSSLLSGSGSTRYVSASCYGTELRVSGSPSFPQSEALAILESALDQE